MNRPKLNVLLIDDNDKDCGFIRRVLAGISAGSFEVECASDYARGLEALRQSRHDVALIDYRLAGGDGLGLVREAGGRDCPVSLILLTGQGGRELDQLAMEAGAIDFLEKGRIDTTILERSIRHSVHQKRLESALRASEAESRRLALVATHTEDAVVIADAGGRIEWINPAFCRLCEYSPDELLGRTPGTLLQGERTDQATVKFMRDRIRAGEGFRTEVLNYSKSGRIYWVEVDVRPVSDGSGPPTQFIAIQRDVTDRRRDEERVRRLNARLQDRVRRTEALRRIDAAIAAGGGLDRTLSVVLDEVAANMDADAAAVLLLDPRGTALEFAGGLGLLDGPLKQARLLLDDGSPGPEALPVLVANLAGATPAFPRAILAAEAGYAAYHAVQLLSAGRPVGLLECFYREPLEGDPERLEFLEALAGQAAIAVGIAALVEDLRRANAALAEAQEAIIAGWSSALDRRDRETEGHSRRVAAMTVEVAEAMGICGEDAVHIRRGALLHDIGKIAVPDSILLKPGPLSEDEWEVMRRHPEHARDMLDPIEFLRPALDIPYFHHERWDGVGYPCGLSRENIPLAARIFAAVDVYDALVNDRPYRKAWGPEEARKHIRSLSGTHLDPTVVDALMRHLATTDPGTSGPSSGVGHVHLGMCEGPAGGAPPSPKRSVPGGCDPPSPSCCGPSPERRRMEILLVDDDPAAQYILGRMLRALGHRVLTASDGEEAWQVLRDRRIRLVLTDWTMPRLDGPGLCRRIRSLAGHPYVYSIMITGNDREEARMEALRAGADDFLAKPVDAQELNARLEIARRVLALREETTGRVAEAERIHANLRRRNEELVEKVSTDPLTGLANRRRFQAAMDSLSARADLRDGPVSLAILDVDRFKSYNDNFGHPAGDEALRRTADTLRLALRKGDLAARYGGEEFVVLMPGSDSREALAQAERIRAKIAGADWPMRPMTVSIGVATTRLSPEVGAFHTLLEQADAALYRAKRSGRDRVIQHV